MKFNFQELKVVISEMGTGRFESLMCNRNKQIERKTASMINTFMLHKNVMVKNISSAF